MLKEPSFKWLVVILAVLVVAACGPSTPQSTPPAPGADPVVKESTAPTKAGDPLMDRLDALAADAQRKEAEYKELERATAENSAKAARQQASALKDGGKYVPDPGGTQVGDAYIKECLGITDVEAFANSLPKKDQLWRMQICSDALKIAARIERIDALVATYNLSSTLTPIATLDRNNLIAERAGLKKDLVQLSKNIPFIISVNSK